MEDQCSDSGPTVGGFAAEGYEGASLESNRVRAGGNLPTERAAERGSLDVQQVTTAELDEWAAYVAGSPTATGLHAPGWRAVLSEAFAVKPIFLRARDNAG